MFKTIIGAVTHCTEYKVKHKFILYKVSISGGKLFRPYSNSVVQVNRQKKSNCQVERKKITCWFGQGHWVGW